ncbi:MAG: aspartate kinase [Thaumarchaeota archaeon]|jgi:aspartate kinase|nr:aspartate kinase [Nitrososphaerota archaeon]|tara:strand:+ start:1047 stop:2519 length:1473 start_codon:yes stop_codon:yes gene_type:complete
MKRRRKLAMRKSLIVVKFGGSALGVNGAGIPRIIRRIRAIRRSTNAGPVIVVSAPRTIYEGNEVSLTDVATDIGENYASLNPVPLDPIIDPYQEIIETFIKKPWKVLMKEVLDSHVQKVKHALNQAMENRRFVDVNRARVLAYSGELTAIAALDYAMRSSDLPGEHIVFENWPIVTDRNFENANFLLDESRKRSESISMCLEEGKLPVMGGYIGVTNEGLETTFERGGSDRTAADLGILLNQDYRVSIDFEKEDVVLSADPNVVSKGLEPVLGMSYNEVDIAGRFGMKIVDPAAVRDLIEADCNLPILVTDMKNAHRVTRIIRNNKKISTITVKIATGKRDCAILELDKSKRTSLEEFLRNVRRYQDFIELRPYQKGKADRARLLFLDGPYVRRHEADLTAFDTESSIRYGLAAITLVGDDMKAKPGIAAGTFGALFREGINIEDGDIQQPTSSILLVVKDAYVDGALRAIHEHRNDMNSQIKRDRPSAK